MHIEDLFSIERRHYHKAEKDVKKVLALEQEYASKTDEELQAVTAALKARLQKGESLQDILPDAFAAAREASRRVIGEFPFEVQVLGGVLLHDGDIAEMKTGEGKTLTAVMPIYLNALEGKGAHVVTVNEYLAQRDAEWMGGIYRFLGLSVGCNLHSLTRSEKRQQFACDITYTTNSELGFDYLRDNMVMDVRNRVLRPLHYAVLDEADSILIDESRTPLIISGAGPAADHRYLQADRFAKMCVRDADYEISRSDNSVSLTEDGIRKAEKAFGIENIYSGLNPMLVHYIQNALRANYLMTKDVEYVVSEDDIILVDQFTGRKMPGREFSDGLHQAIQAKENVGIKQETQTLASITYQNFFRLYDKLSGMTGTAKTEEDEFLNTYNMRVYEIPTNRPVIRTDEPDAVFKTRHEKYEAIADEVERLYKKGQPVLVGTLSVGINEALSELIAKRGIPHQVLNAKNDADEAAIIAKAGQVKAVTIATNMAGRGTDIRLGEGAAELGGLAVLGSERHEAKRIDNQLRGRSGRQGDPGFSRFYASMDDDLFEEFATEESREIIERYLAGKESDKKMRVITDRTQVRAEGLHYDMRVRTLEYDNILMDQRYTVYEQRNRVLESDSTDELVENLISSEISALYEEYAHTKGEAAFRRTLKEFGIDDSGFHAERSSREQKELCRTAVETYRTGMQDVEPAMRTEQEKITFLINLDRAWIRHVDAMEHLKHSIRLRSYAHKKPVEEYRHESYERFDAMLDNIRENTVAALFRMSRENEEGHDEE